MKRTDFHYEYPQDLVATQQLENRTESRLMIVKKNEMAVSHNKFSDILTLLNKDDVLVLNDSKVFACRLMTTRSSGGKQQIILLHPKEGSQWTDEILNKSKCQAQENEWLALIDNSSKVKAEDVFKFENLAIEIITAEGNQRLVRLSYEGALNEILEKIGQMPLPPYMKRLAQSHDVKTYQTIYSKEKGSVAAPTAGLHFNETLLQQLKDKGVEIVTVTLHVGMGTFLPVTTEDIKDHRMHEESYAITETVAHAINKAKREKRRVIVVGTTTARTLESSSYFDESCQSYLVKAESATTRLFIYGSYEPKIFSGMITNFHQPESTLLMFVSALAGFDTIKQAYEIAIKERYRLFSYGDAMFIDLASA